jgi:hypothetical protein
MVYKRKLVILFRERRTGLIRFSLVAQGDG